MLGCAHPFMRGCAKPCLGAAWHRLSQVSVCCLCTTWAQPWLIQVSQPPDVFRFKDAQSDRAGMTPWRSAQGDKGCFPHWVVPRASAAKLIQGSLPAHAGWCEVPAPPNKAQTHQTGFRRLIFIQVFWHALTKFVLMCQ